MFTPTAPAARTARIVAATSEGSGPYPLSTSAVTGTSTAATIRRTASAISVRVSPSPSGRPRLHATPPLVVATASAPADTIITALAASQAFGMTSVPCS